MVSRWRLWGWALLFLALLASGARAQDAKDKKKSAEDKAIENFARLQESTALSWDSSAIQAFARLDHDFVVEGLMAAYKLGRKDHPVQLRALLASALGDREIRSEKELELYRAFFNKTLSRDERHSWACMQAARALARHGKDHEALTAIIAKDKKAWRRVAVLEAYGRTRQRVWLPKVKSWLPIFAKLKDHEREALYPSLAWSIARAAKEAYPEPKPELFAPKAKPVTPKPAPKEGEKNEPESELEKARRKIEELREKAAKAQEEARKKAEAEAQAKRDELRAELRPSILQSIALLEAKKVSRRAREKVARALRFLLGGDIAPVDVGYWQARLEGKDAEVKAAEAGKQGTVERGARFMSIEADGDRLLFLLDASDSMLKPLTPAERTAFRRLFPPSARKSVERSWAGVKTRFDAARVHLISTLKKLDRRQHFAIIWFGDASKVCPATPGFLKASKKNVRRAIQALQTFQASAPTQNKPIGALLGQTNYYRAFAAAFVHSIKGPVKTENPEVHKGLIRHGADMVFLLSDGAPNQDGFAGKSPVFEYERTIYKRVKTGERVIEPTYTDPETGVQVKRPKQTIPTYKNIPTGKVKEKRPSYYSQGPYVRDVPFLEEIERLNLLRKVTIHTISLGEVRKTLLEQIAARAYGTFVDVTG